MPRSPFDYSFFTPATTFDDLRKRLAYKLGVPISSIPSDDRSRREFERKWMITFCEEFLDAMGAVYRVLIEFTNEAVEREDPTMLRAYYIRERNRQIRDEWPQSMPAPMLYTDTPKEALR